MRLPLPLLPLPSLARHARPATRGEIKDSQLRARRGWDCGFRHAGSAPGPTPTPLSAYARAMPCPVLTLPTVLPYYARTTRCPVLTYSMVLPGGTTPSERIRRDDAWG
eukprot:3133767-Rhodomonas_salina.1